MGKCHVREVREQILMNNYSLSLSGAPVLTYGHDFLRSKIALETRSESV